MDKIYINTSFNINFIYNFNKIIKFFTTTTTITITKKVKKILNKIYKFKLQIISLIILFLSPWKYSLP